MTEQITKQQAITLALLKAIQANGGDVQAGFDSIFGEGACKKLAESVWEEINSK